VYQHSYPFRHSGRGFIQERMLSPSASYSELMQILFDSIFCLWYIKKRKDQSSFGRLYFLVKKPPSFRGRWRLLFFTHLRFM